MKKEELVLRVAAGLRAMGEQPDAFIVSDRDFWTYDNPEILGIKVYHLDFDHSFQFYKGAGLDCPFMPLWGTDRSIKPYLSRRFYEGFQDA